MRPLRIRAGIQEGRQVLSDAWRLQHTNLSQTLLLGFVLALLPCMLKAFLVTRAHASLLTLWTDWADAAVSDGQTQGLTALIAVSLQQSGMTNLGITALDLLRSLVFSPLLLSSLALLYNGLVRMAAHPALEAARTAAGHVKSLILVALACMLAEWFVQMVPSLANGLLSLLAELVSWIPVLGPVTAVLAAWLSVLISLLTDFAVIVIFCYVWICAACEGVSGFGALVRSWQLTRNAMHETIASLLMLTLLRWLTVVLFGLLWLFAGRRLGVPLAALVFAYYAISALYTVWMGAVTSALYQRRPSHRGPRPDQFRHSGPDLEHMKRANID